MPQISEEGGNPKEADQNTGRTEHNMENELLAAEIYLHPLNTTDATKSIDEQLKHVEARIQDYTVHLSAADYAVSVASGILSGAIDAFVVGETDFFNHLSKDRLKTQFEEMLDRAKVLFAENTPANSQRFQRAVTASPFADNEFLKAFTINRNPVGLLATIALQLGKGEMIQKDSGGKVRLFPEQNGTGPFQGIPQEDRIFLLILAVIIGILRWLIVTAEDEPLNPSDHGFKTMKNLRKLIRTAPAFSKTVDQIEKWQKQAVNEIKKFHKDNKTPILLERHGNGAAQHYQYENAISTYLWLRYPDKYYIYKFGEVKTVASELESDYKFKKGAYADNVRSFLRFYDEISEALKQDTELVNLFQSQLTETCYPDPELKTLTIDVGFYISRMFSQNKQDNNSDDEDALDGSDPSLFSEEWFPSLEEYTPGFTKEKWLELLNSKKIIGPVWGGVLAAFYEAGGAATCTQIAQKYNKNASSISGNCTQLAKKIYKETQCPLSIRENGKNRYWPILFQGKDAGADVAGGYIWKLRPELYEALTEFDIMRYQWKNEDEPTPDDDDAHYWWLNANPKIWSYANIGVGEVQSYTLFNENGNKRRIFQNFLDAKPGDMVIGYETTPVKQIVALAKISAAQDGEKLYFEKVEGLTSPIDYSALRDCPELAEMEYFQNPQGSLYRLSKAEYDFIIDLIREENPLQAEDKAITYSKNDFLNEVYMTEESYESLVAVLRNKKNIILQGAPGVGKTFAARRLAWSMMGEMDDSRIEFVQFHQNYSYEDFVMGYKPAEDGFELKYGIFYRFCQKAANQPDKEFFFIIDEINRGNMSKIFGELLMLIEKDYRGIKATLAYNGLAFSVPKNLYIIGMMNTADRSLAMIDYALRRRFSFYDMEPGFDSDGFIQYQNGLNNETLNELVERVKELNKEIAMDKSLGKGFCIGHSYFCGRDVCTDEWLHAIVNYDILPMLSEYWFDDAGKLQRWENILRGVFQ